MRLGVACALIGSPRLLIADEPTASLDRTSAESIVALFRTLTGGVDDDAGTAVIVASHDRHVLDHADVLIHLHHGRLVP